MPFLALLHDLPASAVFALFMAVTGLCAVLACRLGAAVVRAPQTKEMIDIAMRSTGAVTAALTLTLAFCAVQARTQMADAQRLVQAEASTIAGFVRLAERLGPHGAPLLPALGAYVHAIAASEFPAMATTGRDPATQRAAEALENAAYGAATLLGNTLADDLLEEADRLEAAREARLHAAAQGLPQQFWLLIALLMALILATGAVYPPRPHILAMLGIQAAGLGALIAFVFLMEQPFRGELAISPEPYRVLERALAHRADPARSVRFLSP
jgi:hypothetical protein